MKNFQHTIYHLLELPVLTPDMFEQVHYWFNLEYGLEEEPSFSFPPHTNPFEDKTSFKVSSQIASLNHDWKFEVRGKEKKILVQWDYLKEEFRLVFTPVIGSFEEISFRILDGKTIFIDSGIGGKTFKCGVRESNKILKSAVNECLWMMDVPESARRCFVTKNTRKL